MNNATKGNRRYWKPESAKKYAECSHNKQNKKKKITFTMPT